MKLKYITTLYESCSRKCIEKEIPFEENYDIENLLINLYPQVAYQTFEGFGGALTDSAGYIYSQMNKEQKKEVLDQYFGMDNMGYCQVRIPIDSCDFSLEHYEADGEEEDEGFQHFSLERAGKYIFPLLEDAEKAYGGKLEIMLSPWSPPVYMKTNGERNCGGKLKAEYKGRWAEYICQYIEAFRERGYHVTMVTLQNEPRAVQTWDSCIYTAQEEKEFLKEYIVPAFQRHGLTDIQIYIWDHNKERAFEWAESILDEETEHMVTGVAFHWYSGDHFEVLKMIREKYPDKKLMLSEACIEYRKFSKEDFLDNAQKYAHDIIGNLNHGMNLFMDWNILLDEQGGPNHVGNFCDAPYLFDRKEKELKETAIRGYLWHFSHFIERGAVRIGFSRYTDKLEVTAFKKNGRIILVLLNRTPETVPAYIRLGEACAKVKAAPFSISTGVIENDVG